MAKINSSGRRTKIHFFVLNTPVNLPRLAYRVYPLLPAHYPRLLRSFLHRTVQILQQRGKRCAANDTEFLINRYFTTGDLR